MPQHRAKQRAITWRKGEREERVRRFICCVIFCDADIGYAHIREKIQKSVDKIPNIVDQTQEKTE